MDLLLLLSSRLSVCLRCSASVFLFTFFIFGWACGTVFRLKDELIRQLHGQSQKYVGNFLNLYFVLRLQEGCSIASLLYSSVKLFKKYIFSPCYLFTCLSDLQGTQWNYLQGNNKALSRYPASCGLIVINLPQLKCVSLCLFFHALTSMDIVYMQRETVEEHFQAMSLSMHSSEQFRHTSR